MVKSNKPDKATFAVRFGCGALFGAVVAWAFAIRIMDFDASVFAVTLFFAVAIVLFGYGAAKAGDEFWYWIGKRWWWF